MPALAPPTDGQLLGRFVRSNDADAFATLVRRLGPTVLAVCRRVCPDEHLAEDAFQAAFVVLARKAEEVQPRERVAVWLYGVAYRTATKARAMLAARRRREAPWPELPEMPVPETTPPDGDELRSLDAAIAALPEHLRAALVVCELDGRSRKEAAEQLGIPEGTLSSRLAEARKRLKLRLRPAVALVPAALANATADAAVSGSASETVNLLARGAMTMLLLHKLKLPAVVLLVAAVLGGLAVATDPPKLIEPNLLKATRPAPAADRPTEYTLGNGLRVRLSPRAGDKKAVVMLFVKAGFLNEPAGATHVAHVCEHLTMFDLPEAQEKAVNGWFKSGQANGETLPDAMYFDLHVPSDEVAAAVKVQAARLSAVEFRKETLVREVPRVLQEIDFVEKSTFPGALGKFSFLPFVQVAYHAKDHQPVRAKTKTLTVADVTAFHKSFFRPDRAALVVAGEFDPKAVAALIDEAFGKIEKPAAAPPVRPELKPGEHTADWDVNSRHLFVAWPVPESSHADHPALTLAAIALTEKLFGDAAFTKLGAAFPTLNDTSGVFAIGVQAKQDVALDDVRKAVLERVTTLADPKTWKPAEVKRLRGQLDPLFSPVELNAISLPPRVTKTMALAQLELNRMSKVLAWGEPDDYRKRLEAVTSEAVIAAVKKHLTTNAATVVRVEKKVW
ncbi:MAG: sigma-70 family RNA polymerase sigma factor [Fimbriiglobus sp.]|jgi:RNA polymerase sigma factor (sigma-70 family)|nr:sigma-70 family RNA polymerase sigma factor [Fimbriiglobus sp.]